jgi:hypothetical protein
MTSNAVAEIMEDAEQAYVDEIAANMVEWLSYDPDEKMRAIDFCRWFAQKLVEDGWEFKGGEEFLRGFEPANTDYDD